MRSLKQILDRFYKEYNFRKRLLHDPVEFPHRYKDPEDIEVAGFIASCFAYGRVELFKPVVDNILSLMGEYPSSFLRDFDVGKQRQRFTFKYRFNESLDILCLLFIIHTLLRRYSSLERAFTHHYAPEDPDTGSGVAGLVAEIISINTSPVYGKKIYPHGLIHFFPSPAKGSACKRMNLFLRWMVRDRDIDFGLWKVIPGNKLVIPLDTHIARIARCLGLTRRASTDWKAAVEITNALKKLDPEDPLKYDFALCHHGISGVCKARGNPGCRDCVFFGLQK
ncbi:MAG: TIGR02757 family protein [Nitrospirae bacterium]|nr:TIGR02757 family protein [Nitrospirota bacterium]MCL5421386.1 TIGR02757 family protein [Nitrospirota bacterium]